MKCTNHPDIETSKKCSVCNRYFCDNCLLPYQKTAFICYDCAAGQYSGDLTKKIGAAESERKQNLKKKRSPQILMLIIIVCVLITAIRLATLETIEPYEVDTNNPEELAAYCGQNLEDLVEKGVIPRMAEFIVVCPPPLQIDETERLIIIKAPEPSAYGFKEIQINRADVHLTVE